MLINKYLAAATAFDDLIQTPGKAIYNQMLLYLLWNSASRNGNIPCHPMLLMKYSFLFFNVILYFFYLLILLHVSIIEFLTCAIVMVHFLLGTDASGTFSLHIKLHPHFCKTYRTRLRLQSQLESSIIYRPILLE